MSEPAAFVARLTLFLVETSRFFCGQVSTASKPNGGTRHKERSAREHSIAENF